MDEEEDKFDEEEEEGIAAGALGTINVGVICNPCQNTGFGSLLFSFVFLLFALVPLPCALVLRLVPFRLGEVEVEEVVEPSSRREKFRRLSVMFINVCCRDRPLRVPSIDLLRLFESSDSCILL